MVRSEVFYPVILQTWASEGAIVVNNLPVSAGDERDLSLIPGSEDPLEKGLATHSSILAWRIPWTEEWWAIQSMGSEKVGQD